MTTAEPQEMEFGPAGPLNGVATVPGDKSISHRALMLASMARGRSRIEGLSKGEDVASTASALEAMGVGMDRSGSAWQVSGVGTGCLLSPRAALEMGNSGTSTRLLMGLVATHPITATFTGDASLSRRPMDRAIRPLERLGATIMAAPGERLPLTVRGASPALGLSYRTSVASAQIKSALLLAGLNAGGITEVAEPIPTRDHSERMLREFGAAIEVRTEAKGKLVRLKGEAELRPQNILVPGDISSAAFLIVAALIVPGSRIRIENVGINSMRTGLLQVLRTMGADISIADERELSGEPVADVHVRHSALRAVDVPHEIVPAMIDEFPAFFVAAAFAEGRSRARGLSELRIKESDRISAMANGLRAIGVDLAESDDGLAISGSAGAPLKGSARIDPQLDHRVAMSFAVAGLHSRSAITVADMNPAATSYPGFAATLAELAAQ